MNKRENLNGKRILIFSAAILIIMVAMISYASIESPSIPISQSRNSIRGIVGVPAEDYYNYSSPITLEQVGSVLNFSLVTPSYLPSGVILAQTRYTSLSNDLYLVYSVNGSLLIKESSKGGLLISEQSASVNPLPPNVIVDSAVVETLTTTIASTTHIVTTFTVTQASTINAGWDNVTIAGQSALVGTYDGQAQ